MLKVLLVFAGGGIGSVVRYGSTLLATRWFGTAFPWGTLAVNLAGCFVIGALFEASAREGLMSPSTRLLLTTGFLGGLTTFSTYALETANFARTGSQFAAVSNLLANNVAGLALVLIGMGLARTVLAGGQ